MRYLAVFIFLTLSVKAISQNIVLRSTRENVIYIGIPNSIDVAVEGYSCKNFTLSTDNGKVERTDNACNYTIQPEKPGKAEFIITSRKSGKQIGRAIFRVRNIPAPVAVVGGKSGGAISRSLLKVQMGIILELMGFDFDVHFKLSKYKITILDGEKCTFIKDCKGPKFPEEVKQALSEITIGSTVLFSDIKYEAFDGTIQNIAPVEFVVTE